MELRNQNLLRLEQESFDVLIVGGGINGAVSAAALSAHGLRVALIDKGDFGGVTSQESSNLAWGGIKYLETGEMALVRMLCRSRNRLIAAYPTAVRETRFLTTLERGFRRSRITLFLGAWMYWLIGECFTRRPRLLSVRDIERRAPEVNARMGPGGIEHSDAHLVDTDARFVFGFVRRALDNGAAAANYIESLGSARGPDGLWSTKARDVISGRLATIRSRVLINACGPGVEAINRLNGIATRHRHIFSKGVHLIVNRIGNSQRVLSFFADDGRLFFVIPLGAKSCIGTTDTRVTDLPPAVTPSDRRFILDNINRRLNLSRPLTESDVIAERCGVRPLAIERDVVADVEADWTALSRKHAVEADRAKGHISIFGGKITDCLNIGEEVVAAIGELGLSPVATGAWYGEPRDELKAAYVRRAAALQLESDPNAPFESPTDRLWRRYGDGAMKLLDDIAQDSRMRETVIDGVELLRCELHYMARYEMVTTLEDLLRRRSYTAQIVRKETLVCARGMMDACRILFGAQACAKFVEYFGAGTEAAAPEQSEKRLRAI